MTTPNLAEFLMSLRTESGSPLVEHAGGQIYVPIWPPGLTIFSVIPPSNSFASVGYRYIFAPDIVPNAFTITFRHLGRDIRVHTVTGAVTQESFWTYALVTKDAPFYLSLTNVSGMNQYFEVISHFIAVPQQADLVTAYKALDDLRGKGHVSFQEEALKLFGEIRAWMGRH